MQGGSKAQMAYLLVNRYLLLTGVVSVIAILSVHAIGKTTCLARAVYGKDCVLCGCTRDCLALLGGKSGMINPWSIVILSIGVVELVFRAIGSCVRFRWRTIAADLLVHAGLIVVFELWNVSNLISL